MKSIFNLFFFFTALFCFAQKQDLKKELIEINPFEEQIFNHIKERNAVIETCSGCTINLYERVWK